MDRRPLRGYAGGAGRGTQLNKYTSNTAFALRYNPVNSYQNRIVYRMKIYNQRFKVMRIVPS
jgi:hypothetical protein